MKSKPLEQHTYTHCDISNTITIRIVEAFLCMWIRMCVWCASERLKLIFCLYRDKMNEYVQQTVCAGYHTSNCIQLQDERYMDCWWWWWRCEWLIRHALTFLCFCNVSFSMMFSNDRSSHSSNGFAVVFSLLFLLVGIFLHTFFSSLLAVVFCFVESPFFEHYHSQVVTSTLDTGGVFKFNESQWQSEHDVYGLWIMQFSFSNSSFNFGFVLDTTHSLTWRRNSHFYALFQTTTEKVFGRFISYTFFLSKNSMEKISELKTVLQQK